MTALLGRGQLAPIGVLVPADVKLPPRTVTESQVGRVRFRVLPLETMPSPATLSPTCKGECGACWPTTSVPNALEVGGSAGTFPSRGKPRGAGAPGRPRLRRRPAAGVGAGRRRLPARPPPARRRPGGHAGGDGAGQCHRRRRRRAPARRRRSPGGGGDTLVVATSGSTGTPKGVVLTHDAVAASAAATSRRLAVDPRPDRWLACLPLAHVGGLAVVARALVTATPLTVLPRSRSRRRRRHRDSHGRHARVAGADRARPPRPGLVPRHRPRCATPPPACRPTPSPPTVSPRPAAASSTTASRSTGVEVRIGRTARCNCGDRCCCGATGLARARLDDPRRRPAVGSPRATSVSVARRTARGARATGRHDRERRRERVARTDRAVHCSAPTAAWPTWRWPGAPIRSGASGSWPSWWPPSPAGRRRSTACAST